MKSRIQLSSVTCAKIDVEVKEKSEIGKEEREAKFHIKLTHFVLAIPIVNYLLSAVSSRLDLLIIKSNSDVRATYLARPLSAVFVADVRGSRAKSPCIMETLCTAGTAISDRVGALR